MQKVCRLASVVLYVLACAGSLLAQPSITSLSPTTGAVGASVKITGANFGPSQGTNTVKFNGTTATSIGSWSSTKIVATVPTGATTGNVTVTVSGVASNGSAFTVVPAPSMTNLSTTSGPVGASVTVTGTNFGSMQGSGTVTFNGAKATSIGSWTATQIVATVPTSATTGDVVVNTSGVASNGINFTVLPTPNVASLSPTTGAVGASVTITGTNFGATQGTSTVTFNGTPATTITGWTPTSIGTTIPTGATTGSVVVTVSGVASNTSKAFTIVAAPSITNLSPTSGAVGVSVTIRGAHFGSTQGSGTVTFNGTTATTITSWGSDMIVATVPVAATTGSVVVNASGVNSNGVAFTVLPSITSLSLTTGAVGASVTITGTNFGSTQGSGTVTFNGTTATLIGSWTATQIVATVPTGATTGNVVVNASGATSNGVNFTVVPAPSITSLSLTTGAVGTPVTITGANFGSTQGSGTVTFNGTTATSIGSWTAAQIVATVPTGAITGNVVVNASGVASNGILFTVQTGSFIPTAGLMTSPRQGASATRLITGSVLITGGMAQSGILNNAEIYSPMSQTFAANGTMNVARWLHTATLLNDGTVLIAGGSDLANKETLDTAEIYDPTAGTFTLLTSTLNTARVGHTATLLNNGQVLIVGGYDPDFGLIADAELYDPSTQTFIDLGDTNSPRYQHSATMLQNGKVLITGGDADPTPNAAFNSAELFDPVAQVFTSVPVPMTAMREGQAAALLNNGQVLITGGDLPGTGSLSSAEVYDPTSNTFAALTSTMTVPRISHAMNLLNGGKVLITGGATDASGSSTPLSSAEVYDPASQTFTATSSMTSVRDHQTTSLLNDGTVLVAGGTDEVNIFNTAELYMTSQLNGLASITIAPASPTLGMGLQQAFTAVGTFGDGSSQTLASAIWSSSNTGVAAVSNDSTDFGAAASLTQGTTTISAAASGITGSASLTIGAPTLASIQLDPQDSTLPVGATQQFTATGVYSDGSTQDLTSTATWSSSQLLVAVINSSGMAAGLLQGVSVIQASSGSISANTNLSVSSPALASIAVTPTSATLAVGASQQFDAMGTYTDGSTQDVTTLAAWSSSATTVATVSATGLAVGTGQGSTAITASFESVSASVPISVGTANLVSIAVTPNAAALTVGGTQQLTATAQYSDGTTQNVTSSSSWASSNSGILNISGAGLATTTAAGEATITATFGSFTGTSVLIANSATAQASLNTSRHLHSATILETGQILIAGGVNCPSAGSCTYLNSAEIYDPSSSTFTNTTGQLAQARSAPSVLLNNGNVLISGGYFCDSSGNCSSQISAEIYNPSAGTFSGAGNMTVPRDGQTMTLLGDGTVLIAGGETCTSATSCTALSSAEIYDPVAETFSPTQNGMSAARYGASAIALGSGLVLIVGGFDGANLPAAAELYDPTQPGFTLNGPNLNTPRYNATATLVNSGKVLVSGGSTCGAPGCPTNAAEIYDPVANAFSTVTNGMNVPRFNHTASLLTNGKVLVAGGYSACSSSCTSEASTETFDPVAGVFNLSQAIATPLAGQTSTLVANGNALFVGGINAGITLASDEWYQPTSLTPPNLVSITLTPASAFLIPGQTQQLVANGTFSDGSTQTLRSVIWNTSNSSAALVSNSPGNAGIVTPQGAGSAMITATTGNVGGSAQVSVAGLASIALTPANPSLTIGQGQQMTAMGTFSDGSAHDITTLATWTSSNNSVAIVGTTPGFQGYAMGVTSGTATVTATLGTISAMTSVSVQPPVVVNPPSVTSANPPTGQAGAQITISGSSFGTSQGGGQVWLGSTYASVVNWGDQQIVAVVAPNSTSGTAQVQQNGAWSNAIPFNVNTANILTVSPNSGVPGTTVTINGSGFAASQGNGLVWLGTAYGIVQNWSDGQIIAQVATGSTSGNAQVLQGGVWSNAVPFTVNSLHITQVSPNSGGAGTTVTISGTGFGASQGSGIVWIGSTNGDVVSWSDAQVIATVDPTALSGVVRIEQKDQWSNAVTFTVPSGASTLTLNPNMLNLVVGETHAIDAVNPSGQQVTGLTWASSNSQIVSLSQDDPPILTALAAGHVTITAGSASADVNVSAGSLPPGTVIWSNPGDGSGVVGIVPAVPSSTGVADVFAFNNDGTVSAVTSDGTTAWTASLNGANWYQTIPDFQGGLVIPTSTSIVKLDGITGQAYPSYSGNNLSTSVVHTDGTTFTVSSSTNTLSVIGTNPTTGAQLFSVALDQSTSTSSSSSTCSGPGCGGVRCLVSQSPGFDMGPMEALTSTSSTTPNIVSAPIIAGDGYFYIAYTYQQQSAVSQSISDLAFGSCGPPDGSSETNTYSSIKTTDTAVHLVLMRVGSDGSSSKIAMKDWESKFMDQSNGSATEDCTSYPCKDSGTFQESVSTVGAVPASPLPLQQIITNADQGTLLSWEADTPAYCASATSNTSGVPPTCNTQVAAASTFAVATTEGASVSGALPVNIPGQATPLYPALQMQDGSYAGYVGIGPSPGVVTQYNMVAFNGSGRTIWSVPNDFPEIATVDGGVIGSSGTTYDGQGSATGQIANTATQSWLGNSYQTDPGQAQQIASTPTVTANDFWDLAGGNPSAESSADPVTHVVLSVFNLYKDAPGDIQSDSSVATKANNTRNFWSTKTKGRLLLDWDGVVIAAKSCDPVAYPNGCGEFPQKDLDEITSAVGAAELVRRFCNPAASPKCSSSGVQMVFTNDIVYFGAAQGYTPYKGSTKTPNFMNITVLATSALEDASTEDSSNHDVSHELGHVFQLRHVGWSLPSNLMCTGILPWIGGIINSCPSHAGGRLGADQIQDAERGAGRFQ